MLILKFYTSIQQFGWIIALPTKSKVFDSFRSTNSDGIAVKFFENSERYVRESIRILPDFFQDSAKELSSRIRAKILWGFGRPQKRAKKVEHYHPSRLSSTHPLLYLSLNSYHYSSLPLSKSFGRTRCLSDISRKFQQISDGSGQIFRMRILQPISTSETLRLVCRVVPCHSGDPTKVDTTKAETYKGRDVQQQRRTKGETYV